MAQAKNAEIWIIVVIVIHRVCCETHVLLYWDGNVFTVSIQSISAAAIDTPSSLQLKNAFAHH